VNCEHREHLLDLVYGELEPAEAERLRAAAEACEVCSDELAELDLLARMADELPLEAPPPSVHETILKAARVQAEQNAAALAEPEPEPKRGLWSSFLEWAGGFVNAPQVAMTMVMLVVVAIGVWYLPQAEEPIGETMTADPEGGEVVATTELVEAEEHAINELPLEPEPEPEVDEETSLALRTRPPRTDRPTEDPEVRPRTQREDPAPAPATARLTPRELEDESSIGERALVTEAVARQAEGVELESVPLPTFDDAVPAEATESPAETRATQQASAMADLDEPQPSPNTIEPIRGDRAAFDRGQERYRARDFRAAADEFSRVVQHPEDDARDLLPQALLQLARSHRQRGACRTAVTHYDDLLRRFPNFRFVPQALLEGADCHRRIGQLSDARRLLERATRYSSTEASAQRELRRLDTIQAAQRAPSAPAAVDSYESGY